MFLRFSATLLLTLAITPNAPASAGREAVQRVAWPQGFPGAAERTRDWTEHVVEDGAFRVRVFLPGHWRKSLQEDKAFVALDLTEGFRFDINPLTPASFDFDRPMPDDTVQGSIAPVQANVGPNGYEVVGAGQARSAGRMWLWHEMRMRSLGVFEKIGWVGSGRVWVFTGTPLSQRLEASCVTLYRRDASTGDVEAQTRRGGAICMGILERLSIERK